MEKPEDRPNFTSLVQRLDSLIESNLAATVSKYGKFLGGIQDYFQDQNV